MDTQELETLRAITLHFEDAKIRQRSQHLAELKECSELNITQLKERISERIAYHRANRHIEQMEISKILYAIVCKLPAD